MEPAESSEGFDQGTAGLLHGSCAVLRRVLQAKVFALSFFGWDGVCGTMYSRYSVRLASTMYRRLGNLVAEKT